MSKSTQRRFEALKYNKPLTDRVVTFSGEGLKHPRNVLVKIGTKVEDVLNELGYNNIEDGDKHFIAYSSTEKNEIGGNGDNSENNDNNNKE